MATEASLGDDASRNTPLSTSSKQAKQPTSHKPHVNPVSESANDFAQPPHSQNHTHNIPLTPLPPLPPIPTTVPPFAAPKRSATTPVSPVSKALRFASITGTKPAESEDKTRLAEPRRKSGVDVTTPEGGGAKRRASAGQKNNVHTRSGRHGDEWLFGGWSRLWVNNPKEDPKGDLK